MPIRHVLALCTLLVCAPACALDAASVAGEYELQGQREMAGALALHPDQTYAAGFSYGAADWSESGKWKIERDAIVLSAGRFQGANPYQLPLMLPAGTRFAYDAGKLTAARDDATLVFVDPNRTPSNAATGEPGEGRMKVRGKVVQLDREQLVVDTGGECMMFDVRSVPRAILERAKVGAPLDAEIAYSAIIGGETCP